MTRRISATRRTVHRLFGACAIAMLSLGSAYAQVYTLTDGNARLELHPMEAATTQAFTVDDGPNTVIQEGYWSNLAGTVKPLYLSVTPIWGITSRQLAPNRLELGYNHLFAPITVLYELAGGSPGNGTASITETVVVGNTFFGVLDLTLFGYSNYSLSSADQAVMQGANSLLQYSNGAALSVSTDLASDHYEINNPDVLLGKLNNSDPLALSDSPQIGTPYPGTPGNAAFAFQWNLQIPPRSLGTITTIKRLSRGAPSTIPEPGSAVLLLTSGLTGLGIMLRGRHRHADKS